MRGKKWGRARLTRHLQRRHGADDSLLRHQARAAGGGRHGQVPHDEGVVHGRDAIRSAARRRSMTYDRANNRIVLQDTRVWVAGLSDEGGVGAWLAAMMKEFGQPDKAESRQARAVRGQGGLGPAAVRRRPAHVRREEEPLLLRPGRAAELSVPARQLDDVDVVEQAGRRSGRSRLRLPARRRRVLVDVPARAELSGSRRRAQYRGSGISTRRSTR